MMRAPKQPTNKNPQLHTNKDAGVRQTSPRYWIVVANPVDAHIYLKKNGLIGRVADEDACCSQPFPGADQPDSDFLPHLAAWLGQAEREEAFDRLVLLGSGETLVLMHHLLPQNAHDRVCAALAKEVAEIRENEIEDHLVSLAWV